MPISLKEFDQVHVSSQGTLPERILGLLERSDQAHTAREVAAELMNIRGAYRRLLDPEVNEVLPAVQGILDHLVGQGKLRSISKAGPLGPETYYAKPL